MLSSVSLIWLYPIWLVLALQLISLNPNLPILALPSSPSLSLEVLAIVPLFFADPLTCDYLIKQLRNHLHCHLIIVC